MTPVLARLFSWTGALLFLVSLTYFLVAYLRTFGAEAPAGAAAGATVWNVALFTVFALHHSVFAREPVRRWTARVVSPGLERPFYVWLASLLFLLVCLWWRPVPGVAWRAEGLTLWVLRGVQVAGLWLTVRGAAAIDVWELAGLTRQTPGLGPRASGPAEFKTRGPYGWVRHPIYAGWFLLVWAAAPMTMTRLVFAAVSCAYLLAAIPLEERTLRAGSAGAYDRYMAAVRWRLVPGVY